MHQYSSHNHYTFKAQLHAQMEDLITESEKIGRLHRGQLKKSQIIKKRINM